MPPVTTSRRPRKRTKIPLLPLLAVAALVVIALVVYRFQSGDTAHPQAPTVPAAPQSPVSVKTSESSASKPSRPKASNTKTEVAESPVETDDVTQFTAAEPSSAATSNVVSSLANRKNEKPYYGDEVEQILGMLASATDASGSPPLPKMDGIDLKKSLLIAITNDIVIYEDDDPKTVAQKERVADMKNQLMEIVKNGGNVEEAIREYQGWVNENNQIRREVIVEYRRLQREASQEEANAYLLAANKELEAEGIETIKMGVARQRGTKKAYPAGMRPRPQNKEGGQP